MKNRNRADLGRIVARRILTDPDDPGGRVVVSIGLPRRDPLSKHRDWECPFLIQGLGKSTVQRAFGVDALQALILAIQGIRANLDYGGQKLFWLDPKVGTDIPQYVPTTWGRELQDRIAVAIERETVRAWRTTIKSRRAEIRAEEKRMRQQGTNRPKVAQALAKKKRVLDDWEAKIQNLKPGWSRLQPRN